MPRSLLVGLDGSEQSQAAVELGIGWAERFDSLLVGIGIVDEPTLRGHQREISRSYQSAYGQLLTQEKHHVELLLEAFSLRCAEAGVAHKLLEEVGDPLEQIVRQAQRFDAILLGGETHFRAAAHTHRCQTLQSVIRSAVRPVVVVPELPDEHRHGILVAYDGSVQAARALQILMATGLQELGPVYVTCVHVCSSLEAARVAELAVEFLRFQGIEAVSKPLVSLQPPGRAFVSLATELGVELLVMGAYGQPSLREFFVGSATCTALAKSRVAVMLYH